MIHKELEFLVNSTLLSFLFGIVIGVIMLYTITLIIFSYRDKQNINTQYINPLNKFMDKYYYNLKFDYRLGNYVYFKYTDKKDDSFLMINIENRGLSHFKNGNIVFTFSENKEVKELHDEYVEMIFNYFKTEIFTNVKNVSGTIISDNHIKTQYLSYKTLYEEIVSNDIEDEDVVDLDLEYNIDSILEKIHTNGMDSLTHKEKEFLKKS